MIQYQLFRARDENKKKEWTVFSDVVSKPELIKNYLDVENKYVEIVLKILSADIKNSIKIEYQFLHNLNTDLIKYYSELDLDAYKMYSKYSREDIYNLTIEALPSYIRLILRESINAIILTNDNIPLFGYINDFETIIYSDSVDEYLINEVNKNGFRIRQIYFSFEVEDE